MLEMKAGLPCSLGISIAIVAEPISSKHLHIESRTIIMSILSDNVEHEKINSTAYSLVR